jgi:hypothetical protein
MKAANTTKPAITTENQLIVAIADAMATEGQATRKWRDVVAPGMIRVYKTLEGATEARDRLIDRAIVPCLSEPFKMALATDLPDTRSKTGKTIAEQNAKAWKATMVPEWLTKAINALPDKAERTSATKRSKTYAGYVEMVQNLKGSARAQCKIQFKRICEYAWPTEKKAKPATPAKPEGDAKPEDSKLSPTQTLVGMLNTARQYAQKHDGLPSQVAVIAQLTKAIELLGS